MKIPILSERKWKSIQPVCWVIGSLVLVVLVLGFPFWFLFSYSLLTEFFGTVSTVPVEQVPFDSVAWKAWDPDYHSTEWYPEDHPTVRQKMVADLVLSQLDGMKWKEILGLLGSRCRLATCSERYDFYKVAKTEVEPATACMVLSYDIGFPMFTWTTPWADTIAGDDEVLHIECMHDGVYSGYSVESPKPSIWDQVIKEYQQMIQMETMQ